MNIANWTSISLLLAALAMPATAEAQTASTPATSAVPAKKKAAAVKHKKTYSKATVSALKAIGSGQAYLAQGAPVVSAAKVQSPMLLAAPVDSLRPADTAASDDGILNLQPTAQSVGFAEDSAFLEDAALAPQAQTAIADNVAALGGESVSVIDRFDSKPRAQAIRSGPLRVRVKDKGLRASVQIPIALGP